MLPATKTRVSLHTDEAVNEEIRRETEQNIAYFANAGPEAIEARLAELDREWDIERVLQTNFSVVGLLGVVLSRLENRSWLLFSGIAAGFMIQHALQGWCPPAPLFRRFGFRTVAEIDAERYALKAIRGDFRRVENQPGEDASH